MSADWTGIVIHIPAEVDCFFGNLKFPPVFLWQERPASPGFLVAQNIAIRSLATFIQAYHPTGQSSRENHYQYGLYK